ncbi:hypothetical protein Y032_1350g3842, partial [Ancylostoma ceylanicum]
MLCIPFTTLRTLPRPTTACPVNSVSWRGEAPKSSLASPSIAISPQ